MNRQLVFIDDSGDPGFKDVSSENFIMAAAVFMEPEVAEQVAEEMSNYRRMLGWQDRHEFKFRKNPKNIIVRLLEMVCRYDFQIYAVYINKKSFCNILPIVDGQKLYNWTIKELLQIIPIDDAKIKIDGRSSKQNMRRTATYLRHEVNSDQRKKVQIEFEDSAENVLIQLADLIAGSINRSLHTEKTDSQNYIRLIRGKIVELKQIDMK